MAFSESLKLEVRRKSAFKCCRCNQIGIDIHHICPQEEGGPDTIDNAAPLCPNCHSWFGGNPKKRKEIIQMRDWWYEQVLKQFLDNRISNTNLETINSKLEEIRKGSVSGLSELKDVMNDFSKRLINDITPENAGTTITGILETSKKSASISGKAMIIPTLSTESKILLKEASIDKEGTIFHLKYLSGVDIQTNSKNMNKGQERREIAKWENAIHELVDSQLIIGIGYKGEIFEITNLGYQVADSYKL